MSMNVSGDTTSVTCSGWTAAGQTCSFEVRTLSQDCGFTSDPMNENISLTGWLTIKGLYLSDYEVLLLVPSPPSTLNVKMEYSSTRHDILSSFLLSLANGTQIISRLEFLL